MYDDVRVQLSPADLRSRDLPGPYIKILTEVCMQINIDNNIIICQQTLFLNMEYALQNVLVKKDQ